MKVTIQFDLPEDKEEYNLVNSAEGWYFCVWEFNEFLRQELKYNDLANSDYETVERLRSKLWEFIEQYNLDINVLS